MTPEEFRLPDANYDRDCALGRELPFRFADNGRSRYRSWPHYARGIPAGGRMLLLLILALVERHRLT
jgi:hypothetical protein